MRRAGGAPHTGKLSNGNRALYPGGGRRKLVLVGRVTRAGGLPNWRSFTALRADRPEKGFSKAIRRNRPRQHHVAGDAGGRAHHFLDLSAHKPAGGKSSDSYQLFVEPLPDDLQSALFTDESGRDRLERKQEDRKERK